MIGTHVTTKDKIKNQISNQTCFQSHQLKKGCFFFQTDLGFKLIIFGFGKLGSNKIRFGCAIDSSIVLMKKHPHIEEMLKTSIMANVDFIIISVVFKTFFAGWTSNQPIAISWWRCFTKRVGTLDCWTTVVDKIC